jgi:pyruvate dehydrogenase E1 component
VTTLLPQPSSEEAAADLPTLESIQRRVLWLATFIVHYANRVRHNPDPIKVGGHQASSASVVSILTALYFDFLRAGDRVAIKPHASPAFHACQYLLGALGKDYLTTLRTWHGLQAYPSRTKDPDPVDFSTGSVGLGCVAPNYAALTERYVSSHFGRSPKRPRFISVLGDAELDEGSVWETVAEPVLEGVDNLIWIVDLNRQSLDRVVPGIRVERWRAMFAANGWAVIDAKYGRSLEAACHRPSGELLRKRIDDLPNDEYQRLLRTPEDELAQRLAGSDESLLQFASSFEPAELARVIADLGGHDLAVLRAALEEADGAGRPAVIFAYTIKGWWLPIAGDPLNHSALLSPEQMAQLRVDLGVPEGAELERFEDGSAEAELCRLSAERLRLGDDEPSRPPALLDIPSDLDADYPGSISTQRAFSLAISELARSHAGVTDRVVTASPDVATSTNLGGWINRRGIFAASDRPDVFSDAGPRLLQWNERRTGQHVELGISENNLFLLLGALGLSEELFSELLFPIGTLYDPFVCRGLDALIYGLYSGARFIVVATPSGVSLSPEGGAHQSVITPSIGLELPQLTYWEPAFALETEWALLEALHAVAARRDGGSSYLRLSTRPVDQSLLPVSEVPAQRDSLRRAVLSGAHRVLAQDTSLVTIAACGVMVPEAIAAARQLLEDDVSAEVVSVTSPGRLYRGYQRAQSQGIRDVTGGGRARPWSHSAFEGGDSPIVTVIDGHPHTLAWLPGALGRQGAALGVTGFGRSGTSSELYREFGIDSEAIVAAAVSLLDR